MSNAALPYGLSGRLAAETDAFIARLAQVPFSRWPLADAPLADAPEAYTPYATAAARLDAVLADQRLGVTAWYVRDLVETSACLACNGVPAAELPNTTQRRRTRERAETAALALLVRPLLPVRDFDTLCGPFAEFRTHD